MRITMREWILGQPLAVEQRNLFEESFLCYGAGAYRAALQFSYLAFLRVLAGRVLAAKRPPELSVNTWKSILKKVGDDFQWEGAIIGAVQRKKDGAVFPVHDDLRDQLVFWRARRNDCAHARRNLIQAPHVEAFWLFIRSNLGRFQVSGSREALLESFREAFAEGQIPGSDEISDMVEQVIACIDPLDLRDFLFDLFKLLDDLDVEYPDGRSNDQTKQVLILLIQRGDDGLREALAQALSDDQLILRSCLLAVPQLVLCFGHDPSMLRHIWRDLLRYGKNCRAEERDLSLGVFLMLLRNSLIPEQAIQRAIDYVLEDLDDDEPRCGYPSRLLDDLEQCGFLDRAYQKACSTGKWTEWCCNNLGLVLELWLRRGLDAVLARLFATIYPCDPMSDEEFIAQAGLNFIDSTMFMQFLRDNPARLGELRDLAAKHAISLEGLNRALELYVY